MLIQTQPTNLGYLMKDGRPAGGALLERATYTCTHCSAVVVMNPDRTRERYKCRGCNHLICDGCAALRAAGGPCHTVQQKYDESCVAAEQGLPYDPFSPVGQSRP
jgi:DNA-directed RNA polymerase subunit RPC12/RpoP